MRYVTLYNSHNGVESVRALGNPKSITAGGAHSGHGTPEGAMELGVWLGLRAQGPPPPNPCVDDPQTFLSR